MGVDTRIRFKLQLCFGFFYYEIRIETFHREVTGHTVHGHVITIPTNVAIRMNRV